jgi:guanine deaminase
MLVVHRSDFIIHSKSLNELEIIENGGVVVDEDGVIKFVAKNEQSLCEFLESEAKKGTRFEELCHGAKILIPGLIDTHAHAPQYVQSGTGTDLPLLDWLNKYTFPTESRFKDISFAATAYELAIKRFLRNGTTTCVWFGSIDLEGNKVLAQTIKRLGQRAFVGKVCMDQHSPEYYIESTQDALRDSQLFVDYVRDLKSPLITPVITPRFVPTCSAPLLKGLASLASSNNVPIQSHLSENIGEINWVKELHPDCKTYTHVYHSFGLLTEKTIMAHCIYLSQEEIELLK